MILNMEVNQSSMHFSHYQHFDATIEQFDFPIVSYFTSVNITIDFFE